MANKHLATYLNDHLAGSVTAVELLTSLEASQANMGIGRFLAELRTEVEADQQELESLMERLQIQVSRPRQAAAWLSEKITKLKLKLDDPNDGTLYLLEALEILTVGIEGKRGLWCALAAAAVPGLQQSDYAYLTLRAEDQHQQVELARLTAAKMALTL